MEFMYFRGMLSTKYLSLNKTNNMKKAIIALFIAAIPAMMHAQNAGLFGHKTSKATLTDPQYAALDAVPEVDGKIVFKTTIAAAGQSKEDIYTKVAQWASLRYEANSTRGVYTDANFYKNLEYASVKAVDKQSGKIQCQGAEELIFSLKPLAKNFTEAFYLLDLTVGEGRVDFNLHNLTFNVDQGEGEFVRVTAEEWISNKECLNKKGEMRRIPSKFRIKTIDLVKELEKEISEAINK